MTNVEKILAKQPYLLKTSSLGHDFLDVAPSSAVGQQALASGLFTTKTFGYRGESITHVVPSN